ncbi:MAG TPA: family 43 glycosylhydrolase [Verrucomicrobiae bacterium]|nr:family 43 glycosylhydrolase [Verrucomicrobiae bacterium]
MSKVKFLRLSLVWLCLVATAFCSLPQWAFGDEVMYRNPVIPGDHPDPSIIRVGKDYWATSTSSEWGPQFPILHSRDLVNWEQMGVVFEHRPAWASGNFWAPEIWQHNGRYYVYYVGRENGGPLAVAVATADKASGPYTDHGPIVAQEQGSIDPAPCVDENGHLYLIWKDDNNSRRQQTTIWAQRLTDDGLKVTGQPTALIHNDVDWEGNLVEGPYMLHRGNYYYLFYSGSGCCGPGCNYALGMARSHSLLGPWEKNPRNPILLGNDVWKCPGHGSIVEDERGRYWLLYHSYSTRSSVYTGREAMLDEVKFGPDDWATIDDGKGPSVEAPSPYGVKQTDRNLGFAENFKERQLRFGWQWPQNLEPNYELRDGHLVLSGEPAHAIDSLDAVLARATLTGDYTAITEIEAADLPEGCCAGLSAFGDPNNAIGLSEGDGKLILWRRDHGDYARLTESEAPKAKKVFLRLTAKDGYQFHFASSTDGVHWLPIGENLTGKNLPPWDRSLRVALTVEGSKTARAEFDSFRLTPDAAAQKN